jgi:hypothetical protein
MANHCWNTLLIEGDPAVLAKLEVLFGKYEDYEYLVDWGNEFFPNMENKPDHDLYTYYGSKWWEFTCMSTSERFLEISGDSAWSPMIKLAELIAKHYSVKCTLHFSESGHDFAGIYEWDGDKEIQKYDCTYAQYIYDEENGISSLIDEYLSYDSFDYYETPEKFLEIVNVDGITSQDIDVLREYYKEHNPIMIDKKATIDELKEIEQHLDNLSMEGLLKKVKKIREELSVEWWDELSTKKDE